MNATAEPASPDARMQARVQARIQSRAQALVALLARIATTRRQGEPMPREALRVAAVGSEPEPGAGDAVGAVGVRVTPWFVNRVWLPLAEPAEQPVRQGLAAETGPWTRHRRGDSPCMS